MESALNLTRKRGLMELALESLNKSNEVVRHGLLAAVERMEKQDLLNPASEPLPLSERSHGFFSMTKFACVNENVVTLEPAEESILESDDGVFFISNNLQTAGVKQDPFFLDLVNSVLR